MILILWNRVLHDVAHQCVMWHFGPGILSISTTFASKWTSLRCQNVSKTATVNKLTISSSLFPRFGACRPPFEKLFFSPVWCWKIGKELLESHQPHGFGPFWNAKISQNFLGTSHTNTSAFSAEAWLNSSTSAHVQHVWPRRLEGKIHLPQGASSFTDTAGRHADG